jgi:glucokinase
MTLLAVDIGGTKVALALITRQGEIVAKDHLPTDPSGPETIIDHIIRFAARSAAEAVGVCVPAVLSHESDRLLWAPNLPGWQDTPLRDLLQSRLELPVFLEYDGHAAVLGEWWAGAAKGYQSVVSIIIGTGVGGGVISAGKLWRGRDRLAGAVGWFPLPGPDGVDHWENLTAGPGIVRRARQLIAAGEPSSLAVESLTARQVFDTARAGDALARQVVEETAVLTGQGVASVISLVNPDIVVLGGSIGQQGDLLLPTVQATARRWAQPFSARDVVITSSTLGAEAGLLGVAYAAFERLSSQAGEYD